MMEDVSFENFENKNIKFISPWILQIGVFKCYISLSILPKSIISFLNSYMKCVWKKMLGTYMKQYDDK